MAEAYKVGVTLELRDLVGARLAALWDDFDKLEKKTVQVRRRLRDLGAETAGLRDAGGAVRAMQRDMLLAERNITRMSGAFKSFNGGNAAGGIKTLHGEFQRAQASAASLGAEIGGIGVQVPELRAAASAIGRMSTNLATAGANARVLGAHLYGVASAAARIPAMPNIPRVGLGGGRGGGGGGGAGGGGGMHGGNVHLGAHGLGVGSLGMGVGAAGAGALIGGYMAYHAVSSGFDAARDYNTAFLRFKGLNLGDATNRDADSLARNSHAFGVNRTEMMKMLGESVGLFGNFEEAKKYAPRIASLAVADQAIYGDKHGALDEQGIGSLLKFIDRRGGFKDDASFDRNLNLGQQLVSGSGGRIKFSDLDQVSQRGGTAFRGLSDQGVRNMAGLIIEQGGNAAGVGMMSLYQNLVAGRTTKKAMVELQDMGIGHVEMQEHGSVGGKPYKSLVMSGIQRDDVLRSDPVTWMHDVLLPKVLQYEKSHGLAQTDDMTAKLINDVLSNRTGSNQGTIITAQHVQLMRDANLNAKSMDAKQTVDAYHNSPVGHQAEFEKSWADFKTAFGESVLPGVVKILDVGTAFLQKASQFDADQSRGISGVQNAHGILGKLKATWDWANGNDGGARPDPVAKPASATVQVHTAINMDGRKVASAVTMHQAKGLSGNLGSGFYDLGIGLPSVGMK